MDRLTYGLVMGSVVVIALSMAVYAGSYFLWVMHVLGLR